MLPHENPNLYRSSAILDAPRERYVPPPVLEPVQPAVEVFYDIDANGKTTRIDAPAPVPPGLKASLGLLRTLAYALGKPAPIITYSRGYDIDANGEAKRAPIWEKSHDPEKGKEKRTKVGEREPEPVDAFVIRLRWVDETGAHVVAGSWLDGAPWTFGSTKADPAFMENFTAWKKHIIALTEERER